MYHYVDGLKLLCDDEINKYWKTIQKDHNWYIPTHNTEYIEYPIQKQSYVSVNIIGGLGNQLFMIAVIYAMGYK